MNTNASTTSHFVTINLFKLGRDLLKISWKNVCGDTTPRNCPKVWMYSFPKLLQRKCGNTTSQDCSKECCGYTIPQNCSKESFDIQARKVGPKNVEDIQFCKATPMKVWKYRSAKLLQWKCGNTIPQSCSKECCGYTHLFSWNKTLFINN